MILLTKIIKCTTQNGLKYVIDPIEYLSLLVMDLEKLKLKNALLNLIPYQIVTDNIYQYAKDLYEANVNLL